jgi:2-amino-4-hydroxy-6-hydroxymethyldihydropteridine diphosphokinase
VSKDAAEALVGLGSNLDGPAHQVDIAFGMLEAIDRTSVITTSSLYRSAPLGGIEQPDFVNAAALLRTHLDARALLEQLQAIERARGRERGDIHWGPRVLDLDLLAFGRLSIDEPGLTVPHPGIASRNFVLLPLREIAPDFDIPGLGRRSMTASRVFRELPEQECHCVDPQFHPRYRQPPIYRRRGADRCGQDCTGEAPGEESIRRTDTGRGLSESLSGELILEEAFQNPFLERFYREGKSAALPTQMFFLFSRARQLEQLRQSDMFATVRICDYLFAKDRLFAELNLDADEFALYEQIADKLAVEAPVPDLVIYLQASVDVLFERIARRGIGFERMIDRSYLEQLADVYARFFHAYNDGPLLIVNKQ